MKDEILSNLENPVQLEKLYRTDKSGFRQAFNALSPELKDNKLSDFWNARLNFAKEEMNWGSRKELLFAILASLFAGVVAKLPAFLHLDEQTFYTRNVGFIIFPILTAYFVWKRHLPKSTIAIITGATLAGVIFINSLPRVLNSDTLLLSCVHMLIFLWSILGLSFVGETRNNVDKRLGFLKYNGDLVVMTTLILIAGGILTGVTIGLFSLIGLNIEKFYFEYVIVFGLPAAPIFGTYLTQSNPQLVGRVSPVIARIFSPLVLVMLVIYLVAMIYSRKDPYNDREFLLIFNILLIGVMAIIFFSVAETSRGSRSVAENWMLFLLSMVTIIVNAIALSAILFRISEWGFTPNRAAVLGSNVLILINLLLVTWKLVKLALKKEPVSAVRDTISSYLPVYCAWAVVVTFIFPVLFAFK